MTATATPATATSIGEALGRTLDVVRTSVVRPTSGTRSKRVEGTEDRLRLLVDRLRRLDGATAIVYARSRRSCEEIARMLRAHGLQLEHYHAGLESERAGAGPGCLRGRRTAGSRRDHGFWDGDRQAGRPPGRAREPPGLARELRADGRSTQAATASSQARPCSSRARVTRRPSVALPSTGASRARTTSRQRVPRSAMARRWQRDPGRRRSQRAVGGRHDPTGARGDARAGGCRDTQASTSAGATEGRRCLRPRPGQEEPWMPCSSGTGPRRSRSY